MTVIKRNYARAFFTPVSIGFGVFSALAVLFAVTFQPSIYQSIFSQVARGCTQVLSGFFDSGHMPHLIAFGIFILLMTIFAVSFFRQWFMTHRFIRSLTLYSGEMHVRAMTNVVYVDGNTSQCFCAGFFRPKIYISRLAVEMLDEHELYAVITHEERHRVARDPLRSAVMRALTHAFFFIPLARSFERRYHEIKEIAADAEVLAIPDGQQLLARALYKLSPFVEPSPAALAFFSDRTLLDLRIEFMSGHIYIPLPVTWSKIFISVLVLILPFALFIPQSRAETIMETPCHDREIVPVHPFLEQPLRYNFSTLKK